MRWFTTLTVLEAVAVLCAVAGLVAAIYAQFSYIASPGLRCS